MALHKGATLLAETKCMWPRMVDSPKTEAGLLKKAKLSLIGMHWVKRQRTRQLGNASHTSEYHALTWFKSSKSCLYSKITHILNSQFEFSVSVWTISMNQEARTLDQMWVQIMWIYTHVFIHMIFSVHYAVVSKHCLSNQYFLSSLDPFQCHDVICFFVCKS